MKVYYDASVIGSAQSDSCSRTGVFRAADALARFLVDHPDVDLNWVIQGNTDSLWGFVDLLKDDPRLNLPLQTSFGQRRSADIALRIISSRAIRSLSKRIIPAIKDWQRRATFSPSLVRDADIFHSPFHRLPRLKDVAPQTVRFQVLHDLIPLKFPDFFSSEVVDRFEATIRELTPNDWVLCSSESTRNDLLNHRDDLIDEQVRVTPLAAADHFKPCSDPIQIAMVRKKYGLGENTRYFLSVATFEPRKNLRHLVSVFNDLKEEMADDVRLVLVGVEGWKTRELLDSVANKSQDRIVVTGYVPDEELSPIYSGAVGFLYPSLYEGFGLPPLEAMRCGTAVVTSSNSSLPEVVGDAAMLIPADSKDELAAAMLRLLDDETWRSSLESAGAARAKRFSWQRCGKLTVQAYRDAVEKR